MTPGTALSAAREMDFELNHDDTTTRRARRKVFVVPVVLLCGA